MRVALDWTEAEPTIPVQACGCDLCATHQATWTSDLHACATCGAVPIATRVVKAARHAIINATVLHGLKGLQRVQAAAVF